jgi:hypothetical protein
LLCGLESRSFFVEHSLYRRRILGLEIRPDQVYTASAEPLLESFRGYSASALWAGSLAVEPWKIHLCLLAVSGCAGGWIFLHAKKIHRTVYLINDPLAVSL